MVKINYFDAVKVELGDKIAIRADLYDVCGAVFKIALTEPESTGISYLLPGGALI